LPAQLVGLTRGTSARDFFTKALGLSVIVITPGAHSVEKLEADMKAERRKSRQAQAREKLWHASLRAEDEAVAHLNNFHPAVAFATACSVEQALAIKWEAEQEEMRRRRDPRKVMCISAGRVRELDVALASLPQGVHPHAAAEHRLLQILKDLPPDRAWWVSHLVVRYQHVQFRRSQLSADREQLADMPISELVLPEAIRRAAARASSDCREIQR
jgi:hypothetical protein